MKRIALLGLGEVGQGFYEVFEHEKSLWSELLIVVMHMSITQETLAGKTVYFVDAKLGIPPLATCFEEVSARNSEG